MYSPSTFISRHSSLLLNLKGALTPLLYRDAMTLSSDLNLHKTQKSASLALVF
jgi:hypothetical protein